MAPPRRPDESVEIGVVVPPTRSGPRPQRRVLGWIPKPSGAPLPSGRELASQVARLFAVALLALVAYVGIVSSLEHAIAQDRLHRTLTDELALGTAPVSEGDFNDVLLPNGAPVAQLTIPEIGLDQTVAEGTDSSALALGPGHRRDTSLPGQVGTSIIMGRQTAFGGPFGRIEELAPGDRFTVVTGQGEQTFEVIGVRYAGDVSPAPLKAGESRLVLETARGPWFMPKGVVRVDSELVSDPQPRGPRYTTYQSLPTAQKEMQGDTSRAWALVFALQLLLVVVVAAVITHRRIGTRQAWAVFVPVGLLAVLIVADQAVRLLPNLM
jgi:LPXTG-site transpeptidase (sortase) family protein